MIYCNQPLGTIDNKKYLLEWLEQAHFHLILETDNVIVFKLTMVDNYTGANF